MSAFVPQADIGARRVSAEAMRPSPLNRVVNCAWFEVRVLPAPPRSPMQTEISRCRANSFARVMYWVKVAHPKGLGVRQAQVIERPANVPFGWLHEVKHDGFRSIASCLETSKYYGDKGDACLPKDINRRRKEMGGRGNLLQQ
jgi:hypothetical protein